MGYFHFLKINYFGIPASIIFRKRAGIPVRKCNECRLVTQVVSVVLESVLTGKHGHGEFWVQLGKLPRQVELRAAVGSGQQ